MLGSETVFTKTITIETDPAAADQFHIMRAPRALTVLGAYMVSENNLGAGTAIDLALQNWDTTGTAVKTGGTIAVASGTGLAANTPLTATLTAAAQYVAQGEWLVLSYTEVGGGYQAGDRVHFQFDYVLGDGV
jgi:hypothetical protein